MRSKGMALILSLILGGVGIHHMYLGNYIRGVLYFMFCWTFIPLALSLFDAFLLLFTTESEFQKLYNRAAINAVKAQMQS